MRIFLAVLILTPQDDTRVLRDSRTKDRMLTAYWGRLSSARPPRFESREKWEARRQELRQQVRRCLGLDPLPERVPLRPVVSGRKEYDDYRLERVWFRTLPEVWASGWLYLPKGTGPFPGVLNPHGHWENGARHPVVQTRCIALAKKGYVALAVDSVHVTHWSVGLCSLTMMTWNNMRALDYLESRPEVDARRIGCTGASGGGQQTMYLMLLEDRIQAAVPVVMISYFQRILSPREDTHCICNFVPGLLAVTDEPEMTAAFAPKPALYISVTGDWTRNFPQEEFPAIQKIYAGLGHSDRVENRHYSGGHDYNRTMREQMMAWFHRWLKNDPDADPIEPEIRTEPPEALDALGAPPKGHRGVGGMVQYFKSRIPSRESDPNLRDQVLEILGEKDVQDAKLKIVSAGTAKWRGFEMERITYTSEKEFVIPALLLHPGAKDEKAPGVIVISPGGKHEVLAKRGDLAEAMLRNGMRVLIPDVRLRGELGRRWDLNCVLWGRPEAGMAAHDVKRAVDVLRPASKKVSVVGLGEMGATALLAAVVDPRIAAVAADDFGSTYRAGRERPILPHLLRFADLPEIARLLRCALWINRPTGAEGFPGAVDLPQSEVTKELSAWLPGS